MPGSLCPRYRVGEPQRAAGMVGNRSLQDDAGVQNREHGKLPKGCEGERDIANALGPRKPGAGASEAPEYSARGKATYTGKGARESTFSSTHSPQ
jgi:hypothetical protein